MRGKNKRGALNMRKYSRFLINGCILATVLLFVTLFLFGKTDDTVHAASPDVCPITDTVDIYEEIDVPTYSGTNGPRILENKDVTVGPGLELDESHEIDNPSNFAGMIEVDIDPDNGEIHFTGSPVDPSIVGSIGVGDYNYARVEIKTDEIKAIKSYKR